MIVLGVMTGTSCDGLDAVCVEFSPSSDWPDWRIRWSASLPYPKLLREKILHLQLPGQKISLKALMSADAELGSWYGSSIQKLIVKYGGAPGNKHDAYPQVIANHGQTVAHFPDLGTTLQLGNPAQIAQATGLTLVSHFREGDMACGGQGAPLLPLFHRALATKLPEFQRGVAIHNLGGISNLTYLNPSSKGQIQTIAFDTGPSNIWIDEAVAVVTRGKKKYDLGGAFARKGVPDLAAIKCILQNSYFKKAPPKSTGRDDFPFSMLKAATRARGNDLIATAAYLTVESIARAYEKFILKKGFPLQTIYCAGGGAKNGFLLERLANRLPSLEVRRLTDAKIDNLSEQALEGAGFAMFGYLSLTGQALGGSWTGARSFGSPGWITPGKNWSTVVSLASGFLK